MTTTPRFLGLRLFFGLRLFGLRLFGLRFLGLGALVLGLAGPLGCGTLHDGPPANTCGSDGDCTAGTCDVGLGMCVSAPARAMTVALEVRPASDPFGGSITTIGFSPFELEGPLWNHALELPLGVPTWGIVRDGDLGEPVTAEVRFTLASAIPGRPAVVTSVQSTAAVTSPAGGPESNFAAQLLPGGEYEVTIQPNGDWRGRLPPLRPGRYRSSTGTGNQLPDEVTLYPQSCSASDLTAAMRALVEGTPVPSCLASFEGSLVDEEGTGQSGMQVRIVARATGQVLSSTCTTVDAEPGAFRVVLPLATRLDAASWFFQISPSRERAEAEGPGATFLVDPVALYEEDGLIRILTPTRDRVVTYRGVVEAPESTGGAPVSNASLVFSSQDIFDIETGIAGAYQTTATTDMDGAFEVRLLPGTYDVVATPIDVTGDLGVLRQEVRIDPAAAPGTGDIVLMGQLFQLPSRVLFGGTVQTNDGRGMINARVRAQSLGRDLDGALDGAAFFARSTDTLSDPNGLFVLRLDVGVYDIVVEPPVGTNFPWSVVLDQPIGSSGGEPVPAPPLELQNPVPISGIASFAGEGGAVAEGEVRAYAVIETESGFRALQIGRTTTDAEGRYTLLLPPSL